MKDLERLSSAERTALAEEMARKGEVLGHRLAEDGHPVVVRLGGFNFLHAGKKYSTGEYAPETLSEMAALADFEVSRELGQPPAKPRLNSLPWFVFLGALLLGVLIGPESEASVFSGLLVLFFAIGSLILVSIMLVRAPRLEKEYAHRKKRYEWSRQVIAEPIWAGMLIALSEYEADRYAAQKEAQIEELKRQHDASQPYYPEPEQETQVVSITKPMHQELWNPTRLHSASSTPQLFNRGTQSKTFKEAEWKCAEWLRSRGETSALLTRDGADGGVDIISNRFVCQVKNYKGSVGVSAVRDLYGISMAEGKKALFFTTGSYTKSAIEFADRVDMPLLLFNSRTSEASPASKSAASFLALRKV